MDSPLYWFLLTLVCVFIHAFFTMQEMAIVSFNKIRLQWQVTKGTKRAIWIQGLLEHPSRLFGTTLLAVNIAVQVGSECSRQFYQSIGFSPDLAPVTQVFVVMIIAELSPMFAARRYPEHTAMLGSPIIYACSKLFFPFVWLMGITSKVVNRLIGSRGNDSERFLSRDELQRVLEEQDEEATEREEDLSRIVGNIFSLRSKTAKQVMEPLTILQMIPSNCTIGRMRRLLGHAYYPHIPIYHRSPSNIVAIAFPSDILRFADNHRARDHSRPPWFITSDTPVIQVLKQFRRNNQSVAIVLDKAGAAIGLLTLDDILVEIFGQVDRSLRTRPKKRRKVIERTFPGEMTIAEFNKQFETKLDGGGADTLAQLLSQKLGHHPEPGDTIRIGAFELRAEDTHLLGARKVNVKTFV